MILAIACVNAFVVAGFLMHLISEKKMIYTVLAFTVFFFTGLIGLTVYAMQDFPTGTRRTEMSLKAFHLIFVTLLTTLSFGCAAWAFMDYRGPDGTTGDLLFSLAAVAVGILVIIYGVYFLKKLKKMSYL